MNNSDADGIASECKPGTVAVPGGVWVAQGGGRTADVPGGAGRTAAALPCLNTINCNEGKKKLSSGHRKTAFALMLNVLNEADSVMLHSRRVITARYATLMTEWEKWCPFWCPFGLPQTLTSLLHTQLGVVAGGGIEPPIQFRAIECDQSIVNNNL